jgi:hypothetical protein
MDELCVLWNRYQTAMESYKAAADYTRQAASWKEAQEWLRRYFDSVDQELKRQGLKRIPINGRSA